MRIGKQPTKIKNGMCEHGCCDGCPQGCFDLPFTPFKGLPTAADFLNDQFEKDRKIWNLGKVVWDELNKLSEEAERHRIDYNYRSQDTEQPHYWRGRRDEAGHFRDRIIALLDSLGNK